MKIIWYLIIPSLILIIPITIATIIAIWGIRKNKKTGK